MKILALCSALNNSYLAFDNDGKIVSKIIKSDENYHSLYLIKEIKNILQGFDMKNLDYIVVNVGPGSFTGIRVALTIAKVMAGELNIPLVPLDTANILLEAFLADLYMSDARRDMYFIGTKDKIDLIYKDKAEEIIKDFKNKKIVCDKRLSSLIHGAICYEDAEIDLGKVMLKLAREKYETTNDKTVFNPLAVKANYIQTPPVF